MLAICEEEAEGLFSRGVPVPVTAGLRAESEMEAGIENQSSGIKELFYSDTG